VGQNFRNSQAEGVWHPELRCEVRLTFGVLCLDRLQPNDEERYPCCHSKIEQMAARQNDMATTSPAARLRLYFFRSFV